MVKGGGSKTRFDADKGSIDRETGKFRYNTNTDTGVARKGDDVYVGNDDNVYRRTDDGWQHKTDGGWEDTQRDPDRVAHTRDLDQQRQSRDVGNQRVDNYQRAGAYRSNNIGRGEIPARGGGGAGPRGGMRGRR